MSPLAEKKPNKKRPNTRDTYLSWLGRNEVHFAAYHAGVRRLEEHDQNSDVVVSAG